MELKMPLHDVEELTHFFQMLSGKVRDTFPNARIIVHADGRDLQIDYIQFLDNPVGGEIRIHVKPESRKGMNHDSAVSVYDS